MRSTKLFYYLSHLSSKQKKSFADYLASPYFCKKPEPGALFSVLDKRLLRYKLSELSTEEAFEEVFPGQPFDKDVMRKLMNRLLELYMDFLSHEILQDDKGLRLYMTHKKVSAMGADRYFDFLHKKLLDTLDENHLGYFERAFHAEMNRAELQARKSVRRGKADIDLMDYLLEQGFANRKLNLAFDLLNDAHIMGGKTQLKGMDQLLANLKANIDERPYLVQMMYHRYMSIANREELTHFHKLRALLDKHGLEIRPEMAGDLFLGILQFCIYRVNNGDADFLPELLKVYQSMLRQGHLMDGQYLPAGHFKNIVAVASRSGEYDWAEWFLDQYGPLLSPAESTNALLYNRAILDYFLERRAEAESGFLEVIKDNKDIYYGVDARIYLLRIFYEAANVDGMESLCHSFRIFLMRSKNLPDNRKKRYLTFLGFYRRLINIAPRDGERLLKLRNDILDSPKIGPREWLLEKVNGFIKDLPQRYRNGQAGEGNSETESF